MTAKRSRISGLAFVAFWALCLVAAGSSTAFAAPAAPSISSPRSGALVHGSVVLTGRVDAATIALGITGGTDATYTIGSVDATGASFVATVTVPYGKSMIAVRAVDGAGESTAHTVTVWDLRITPHATDMVLVDKSDFMLYVLDGGFVTTAFPIAIGTRSTPTPTGTRYLGRPVPPGKGGPAWGPFRMPLLKWTTVRVRYYVRVRHHLVRRYRSVRKLVRTSYYIHGTNEPDSIGTPASHGCVRMWNSNLWKFRSLTCKNELTVIRN